MKKALFVPVSLFVFLALACSNTVTSQKSNSPGNSTNSQKAKPEQKPDDQLRNRIEQLASAAKGRVGVAAKMLETGEAVFFNAKDHFPMQSVYKLPIGMAVLRQVDAGKLSLDQRVRVEKSDFVRPGQRSPVRDKYPNGTELTVGELLRLMVLESDGTASDVLMKLAGGAEAVQKYLSELEIAEIIVANTEKEFAEDRMLQYRNWASPEGAVALLSALQTGRGLSEQSRARLLKFMTESPTGPKRLKGLLPQEAIVAHKTGTSGTSEGLTAATNDIGIVTLPDGRHLAIAVFVMDSPADEATREQVIAKIARAVWDQWSN